MILHMAVKFLKSIARFWKTGKRGGGRKEGREGEVRKDSLRLSLWGGHTRHRVIRTGVEDERGNLGWAFCGVMGWCFGFGGIWWRVWGGALWGCLEVGICVVR